MLELVKSLCTLYGTSGDEGRVADFIIDYISKIDGVSFDVDALGSVVVFKKGRNTPANKVMLDAHTDEVGLIINEITDEGFIKFATVGGINENVLIGRRVRVGGGLLPGVIGLKPVHLLSDDERKTLPKVKDMYIDIGASTRDEAAKFVSEGDFAYFDSDFVEFGEYKVKCRAIDDRYGCALMLKLLSEELEYDTWFSFSVQEEVGSRGAKVTAYNVAPDYAVVLEATTAADIIDVEGAKRVCVQGDGPAVSFMDRGTVYSKELCRRAIDTARAQGVPCQYKTLVAGGNNAAAVHKAGAGVKVLSVSIPCRYLHSAVSVADKRDFEHAYAFVKAVLPMLYND